MTSSDIETLVTSSWSKIAPFWPLKNLIAVNPMAGFEDLPFEDALREAQTYFQQKDLPKNMQHVNLESIKWLQVFFDEGQATIKMPLRHLGLLHSTTTLFRFDNRLLAKSHPKRQWLTSLSENPDEIIADVLCKLGITAQDHTTFLTLMLTTLPGWAAYTQYRTNWADAKDAQHPNPVTQKEYLAFRLVLTYLLWPDAKQLLEWHAHAHKTSDSTSTYQHIVASENAYQETLLGKLTGTLPSDKSTANAQLVCCIDVRPEPFCRALESQGNYDTYGFAGFFGVPVAIENPITGDSCTVLSRVVQTRTYRRRRFPAGSLHWRIGTCQASHQNLQGMKRLYQSVKYTFTTPFSLVETLGIGSGLWMLLKSVSPRGAAVIRARLKSLINPSYGVRPDITSIPFEEQVTYGAGALQMLGMTENFAPLVVFCGHCSTTQNNAYTTALDCGACGGRNGAPNARILAAILNQAAVRDALQKQGISIPDATYFLAAEHNTTTDLVTVFSADAPAELAPQIATLNKDLAAARQQNSLVRSATMGLNLTPEKAQKEMVNRSQDWAQVRPEWGLARNASFIIGPRWLTKNSDLEGRSFLHAYDWQQDKDGIFLTKIMTAPMVVTQWINAQYFFSSWDNVAFGGGSKITRNIVGKMGIMQGNASDLMTGLALQSVYKTDLEAYHQPLRLTVVVVAPRALIDAIIPQHAILKKLFGNGWIHLICHDPETKQHYKLQRDFGWLVY